MFKIMINLSISHNSDEKSLKAGSFLNSGPLIISKSFRALNVVLPCRTDEFVESGVELFINHVKQTKGIQFDPRFIYSETYRTVRNSLFSELFLIHLCFFS